MLNEPTARIVICVPQQNTIFPSAPASKHQPPARGMGKNTALLPSQPQAARAPSLSWLPDVSRTLCARGMMNFTLSPSISEAGSGIPVAWSSKGEFLHGAGGAAELSRDALHAVVVCAAPALRLIFCFHCTQAVIGLCFQPFP